MHAASQRKKRRKLIFPQLFVLFGGPEEALNVLTEDVKRNVPVRYRYCIFSATKKLIYFTAGSATLYFIYWKLVQFEK
jgi:hypothetical protein